MRKKWKVRLGRSCKEKASKNENRYVKRQKIGYNFKA